MKLPGWFRTRRTPARHAPKPARPSVFQLLDGYRATCLVTTAVQIGLIDRLANGPARADEIARDLGLHAPSLARLLRGLAAIELVQRRDGGFELARLGRALRDDPFARDLAVLTAEEYLPAWSRLRHGVATGESAFAHAFGESAWQHRERHPDLNERFNRLMTRFQERAAEAIARVFDFSRCDLVVDVGGGRGRLLAGILAQHERLRGIVFDQLHVVEAATSEIAAAGLGDRCRAVGGSFFDAVPAGGDVYLLRHILHDWEDADCIRILARCRAAMGDASTLLVAESVMPADAAVTERHALLDLHMLVVPGGRERTQVEYEGLLHESGFALVGSVATGVGGDLIEAKPR